MLGKVNAILGKIPIIEILHNWLRGFALNQGEKVNDFLRHLGICLFVDFTEHCQNGFCDFMDMSMEVIFKRFAIGTASR